jgi:hypothetical protein
MKLPFLGAFAKLLNMTVSFVITVWLSKSAHKTTRLQLIFN